MVAVLLIAGIGFLVAGLLAIGFGIPVKEFSFGNTLIFTGAIVACTGMIMVGLWMVVRELRNIARQLGPSVANELHAASMSLAPPGMSAASANQAAEEGGFLSSRDQATPENAKPAARSAAPSHSPEEVASAVKRRRNLLFSSSSRKERERAFARTPDPSAADLRPAPPTAPPAFESSEAPPATFEDAWPKPERARAADEPPQRRSGRAPSTFAEANTGPAGTDRYPHAARNEDQPAVTVLKSGVVDGMAYSLYSDGSIEAQMPEGMMRFASIDELRSHLDQRP
jgi:hypothetical protein